MGGIASPWQIGVVALSVLGAAATLYALGWVLQKVLVAFPGWVAGLWSAATSVTEELEELRYNTATRR